MNCYGVIAFLLIGLIVLVKCQDKKPEPKVGEPQFSLQAAGGGNNAKNFGLGYNAGVGTKVWESKKKDMSLELGTSYGQGVARVNGRTYKSEPTYGLGGTFRWGRK